jgi:hypothetical protein
VYGAVEVIAISEVYKVGVTVYFVSEGQVTPPLILVVDVRFDSRKCFSVI